MEFFNGPVERWVKSEKTPCCLLRGLPWRFLKFQIHWSLAVPNSTPTPPPWPEITFLVSFSPTGYSLTFGQPALAIGQTTYQADTWPMGKQIETQVQRSRKTLENHTHLYQRMIHEKGSTNRSGWTIHWQTVQLQLERVAPKFWTTFSIVLSVAEVAERNPFAANFVKNFATPNFPFRFSPPTHPPKNESTRKTHSKSKPETSPPSRNKKVPAQKNTPGLARRVDFFHSAPPGWHRVAHRTSRTSPPIAMRQEKGPQKHEVCGVDVRIVFLGGWLGWGWVFHVFKRLFNQK